MIDLLMKTALSALVLGVPVVTVSALLDSLFDPVPDWAMWACMAAVALCGLTFIGSLTAVAMLWVWAL